MIRLWGTKLKKTRFADAGWDLVAAHDAVVTNEGVTVIETTSRGDVPAGMFGKIEGRSGLATKHGIFTLGGVVDAGYDGVIKVALSKVGSEPYAVKAGDRVAQIVITPLAMYAPGEVAGRGDAGFGSSGR